MAWVPPAWGTEAECGPATEGHGRQRETVTHEVVQSWWLPPLGAPRPSEAELALPFWEGAPTQKGTRLLLP